MTLPDQDVMARARTIFERLRAEQQPPPREETEAPAVVDPDGPRAGAAAAGADDLASGGQAAGGEGQVGEPGPGDPAPPPPPVAAAGPDDAAVGALEGGAVAVGEEEGGLDSGRGVDEPPEALATLPSVPADALAAPVTVPDTSDAPATLPDTSGAPADLAGSPVDLADPPVDVPGPSDALAGSPGPLAAAPDPRSEGEAVAPRGTPRVMAIANQKGGVGKTTTAVNLGAALAELGLRVLVVDLDPQGNATTGLGINSRNLDRSIYDVLLHDAALDDCVEPTSLRNLFVAPATIELAGAEIELVPAFSRELRLRRAVDDVRDDFDYVLIDCPPSLGLLTVNGLAAADEVLVPIQCEYYALEGLGQLLRNVNLVKANLNPGLEVSTIVLTMYDARTKLAEQVTREVRTHFGAKVCRNVVPRTVRLSEAPSFGQPVTLFDPTSRGSIAYRELAKEVHRGPSERAR